ncbi:MAG: hypothetical protein FWC80_02155 [Firmicutes bacterium]|nr:hypothetical protein [Bacillota bacterium]
MLDTIVDQILSAEANAEEIIGKAEAEAKAIKFSSDVALEKKRKEFEHNLKVEREKTYNITEKKAETDYNMAIKDTENQVLKLTSNAQKKMKKAVTLILDQLSNL